MSYKSKLKNLPSLSCHKCHSAFFMRSWVCFAFIHILYLLSVSQCLYCFYVSWPFFQYWLICRQSYELCMNHSDILWPVVRYNKWINEPKELKEFVCYLSPLTDVPPSAPEDQTSQTPDRHEDSELTSWLRTFGADQDSIEKVSPWTWHGCYVSYCDRISDESCSWFSLVHTVSVIINSISIVFSCNDFVPVTQSLSLYFPRYWMRSIRWTTSSMM